MATAIENLVVVVDVSASMEDGSSQTDLDHVRKAVHMMINNKVCPLRSACMHSCSHLFQP